MTKNTRYWFTLCATSLCAFALSGCGDERPGSEVVGARRTPVLNQQTLEQAGMQPSTRAPSNLSQNAKVAAQSSPFDQYDESGNRKGETSILGGLFDDEPKQPQKAPAPMRKPLPGNAAYGAGTRAPAVQSTLPPVIVARPASIPPVASAPVVSAPAPAQAPSPISVPAVSNPAAASEGSQYVPLSSVPQRPGRFAEIREEKKQQLQEMQNDNAQAQLQKEVLYSEPSELAPQPVNETAPQPVAIAPMPSAAMASAPAPAAAPAAGYDTLPSPLLLQQKKAVTTAQ